MGWSLIAIVFLLVYVVFFVLGVWMIVRGIRGPISASDPHCRACKYALREVLVAGSKNCPECGADLEDRRAVLFGRTRRRPLLALAGVGVIILPIIASIVLTFVARSSRQTAPMIAAAGPARFSTLTNAELVTAIGQNPSGPWIWEEVAARRETGVLDAEEIAAVLDSVAAAIENEMATVNSITPWGGDQLHAIIRDETVPEASRKRLAEAMAPNAKFRLWPRLKQGTDRYVYVELKGLDLGRGDDVLVAIHGLRIVGDGFEREVETQSPRFGRPTDPPARFAGSDAFASSFAIPTDLPIGQYEIHADVEVAALFDKPPLLDSRRRPRHPDAWSDSLIRRRTTISSALEVIAPDEQVVEFLPPGPSAIAAKQYRESLGHVGLKVEPQSSGELRVTLLRPSSNLSTVRTTESYCFQVVAIFGDMEVPILTESGRSGGRSTKGNGGKIEALPADIKKAVVEFRPAPDEASGMIWPDEDGNLPRIIGEVVRFEDVDVERLDL